MGATLGATWRSTSSAAAASVTTRLEAGEQLRNLARGFRSLLFRQ
ncbi:hypothetical protein [Longimycelium tulufanense]|nr:hypothetical protein [Longimycelium tulufanense]